MGEKKKSGLTDALSCALANPDVFNSVAEETGVRQEDAEKVFGATVRMALSALGKIVADEGMRDAESALAEFERSFPKLERAAEEFSGDFFDDGAGGSLFGRMRREPSVLSSLVGFLFEKFFSSDESLDEKPASRRRWFALCCVAWVGPDLESAGRMDYVYAMLRYAFDSETFDSEDREKETAIAVIEEVRDRVCLQILGDALNSGTFDDRLDLAEYAEKIRSELESEVYGG